MVNHILRTPVLLFVSIKMVIEKEKVHRTKKNKNDDKMKTHVATMSSKKGTAMF